MKNKPPKLKKLTLFDKVIKEIEETQSEFDRSPRNSYPDASKRFRTSIIKRKYYELLGAVKKWETSFPEELFIDEEEEGVWDSKGWTKNPDIQFARSRAKKLFPMLDYLSSIMNHYRTTELQKRIPDKDKWYKDIENSKGELVSRELSLFCFEDDNYDEITDILDCSDITIRKYLSALERVGTIINVYGGSGGGKTRTSTIYAFGYWRQVRSKDYEGPKFEPFLIGKTSEMLHGFKLR